ncbi:MAG: ABC transporter permease [Ilumatobacteraceae bacterium]
MTLQADLETTAAPAVTGEDGASPVGTGSTAGRHRPIDVLGPIAGLVVFVGLWWLMHAWILENVFDKPSFLVPSPATVVDRAYLDAAVRGDMLQALGWTALVALCGVAVSIVVGTLLAVVMAQATWIERSFWPYLIAAQAIPILAIVPILGNVFGFGFGTRILVCVIISVFPIVSNTLFGLLSADPSQHDLFTLKGASRWTRLIKLQLPSATPAIFTGYRIAAGLSVIGAVVGELFFRQGGKGIGILMDEYRGRGQWPQTYGALVLSSLLGVAVFMFFGWLSNLVIGRWHESTRKSG